MCIILVEAGRRMGEAKRGWKEDSGRKEEKHYLIFPDRLTVHSRSSFGKLLEVTTVPITA